MSTLRDWTLAPPPPDKSLLDRIREAFALRRAGLEMDARRIRREHPTWSDEEVHDALVDLALKTPLPGENEAGMIRRSSWPSR